MPTGIERSTLIGAFLDFLEARPHYAQLKTTADRIQDLTIQERTAVVLWSGFEPLPPITDLLRQALSEFEPAIEETHIRATSPCSMTGARFRDFFAGPESRLAVAAAQAIAEGEIRYSPLLIHGGAALGKTHLLQATATHALERQPDLTIALLEGGTVAPAALMPQTPADLLLIDNVHRLSAECQTELVRLLDQTINRRRIVLTSLYHPTRIPTMLDSLVSRLQWGVVTTLEPPCVRARELYLLRRTTELHLFLPEDVSLYLAENTCGPLPELEGLLQTLRSHAELLQQPVTIDLVHQLLSTRSRPVMRTVTLGRIDQAVCQHFGLNPQTLPSKGRSRSIAYPRQIAMFLAHELTSSSLEEIGRHYGGRDHSTVKHGCEKIRLLVERDADVRGVLTELRQALSAASIP